jgi:hypothetical protein
MRVGVRIVSFRLEHHILVCIVKYFIRHHSFFDRMHKLSMGIKGEHYCISKTTEGVIFGFPKSKDSDTGLQSSNPDYTEPSPYGDGGWGGGV